MTENPTDIFKAVATPPPELQQMLAYHADNGSVLTGVKPRPAKEQQKDANLDDMASNLVMQHLSEQERIYQEYREQSERINQATELALANASTPEERQEILEYQQLTQKIDEKIEQKREAGTLTQEDIEQAETLKRQEMPESVENYYDATPTPEPKTSDTDLASIDNFSGTSLAASSDGTAFENLPDMNTSFQAAVSGTGTDGSKPAGLDNTGPVTPADLSKFTF